MRKKGRNTQSEPVFTGPGVCELLKTTRERAGEDLQTVSQVLRIRHVYLEAIEAGKYDELPGKTYVVGFVRAYADFLGLDAEEVVKRFKSEIDGLEGREDLVFPSPVTEQSVPGGAIILISLIILGGVYGGWYFLSSQDRSMAELVPDLPAKFAEMMENVKGTDKTPEDIVEEAMQEPTLIEETAELVTIAPDTQAMAQKALEAVSETETQEKEVAQSIETVKIEKNVEAVEEKVETLIEEEKTVVEEVKKIVEPKVEETVKEVVTEPVKTDVKTVVAEVVEETNDKVEAKPDTPEVMNEKITLKAIDYSWIQITDVKGNVHDTQVLNAGDEYEIPALQGLILRTGNAGGLDVFVDGKKVPSVGDSGEVRRKIFMDPVKLIDGNAVDS